MKATKKQHSNWLLIGALMFFLTTAGFTIEKEKDLSDDSLFCFICDATDTCRIAYGDQIGQSICIDGLEFPISNSYCDTSGSLCDGKPIPVEN